jgi:hypothetical protein
MFLIWSMALLGVFFTILLAAVRAAEHRRLHALRVELEKQAGKNPPTGLRVRPVTRGSPRPETSGDEVS